MWPFKKKVNEDEFNKEAEKRCKEKLEEWGEKIKPKYKYDKDRFDVYIYKDNNQFLIKVLDLWSRIFFSNKKGKEGFLDCRTVTFSLNEKGSEKEEEYISIRLTKLKNI